MIHYLKGILEYKSPTFIIVDVGGVGYEINIPLSSFDHLPPEGKEIKINTYLHLREDGVTLYGFLTQEERDFFGLQKYTQVEIPMGSILLIDSFVVLYHLLVP